MIQLRGTNRNDVLTATLPDEYWIVGLDGRDQLTGGSFSDYLNGGTGADRLYGGGGNDRLLGGSGNDYLSGGSGNDILEGGSGADELVGGEGIDTASYQQSTARVIVDLMAGSGAGGDAQGDVLKGIENVTGSAYNDVLYGGLGWNVLNGGAGNDRLYGRDGNDTLEGGAGADYLDGGTGFDTADYSKSSAAVEVNLAANSASGGDAQGDGFRSIERVVGSDFDDTLAGNSADNTLEGGLGNDTLIGGAGNDLLMDFDGDNTFVGGAGADHILGGSEVDTLTYEFSSAGVTVNLLTNSGAGGDAEGDHIWSINNLIGSSYDDNLTGTQGDNVIQAGDGDDVIRGGAGIDDIWGGAGNDRFVFNEQDQGSWGSPWDFEGIRDFTAGGTEDVIDLRDAGTGYTSLDDILANSEVLTSEDGSFGTLIDLGPSGAVILLGVTPDLLTEADFIFESGVG
jgi:Ca2+-binding RTX toxin-like protein